jgi:hypothetical protein
MTVVTGLTGVVTGGAGRDLEGLEGERGKKRDLFSSVALHLRSVRVALVGECWYSGRGLVGLGLAGVVFGGLYLVGVA